MQLLSGIALLFLIFSCVSYLKINKKQKERLSILEETITELEQYKIRFSENINNKQR